jgi:hypothetical protein
MITREESSMNITIKKTITTELGVRLDTGKPLINGFGTPYATETREPEPHELPLIASAVLDAMTAEQRAAWLAERGPVARSLYGGGMVSETEVLRGHIREVDLALGTHDGESTVAAARRVVAERDGLRRQRDVLDRTVDDLAAKRDEAIARAEKAEAEATAERERAGMFKRERDEARTERNEAEVELARWLPVVEAVGTARRDRAVNLGAYVVQEGGYDPYIEYRDDGTALQVYEPELDLWRAYDAAVKAGES